MSTINFFESCLNTAVNKFYELCDTPKGRTAGLNDELKDIKNKIQTAINYGEISPQEGASLIKRFNEINFEHVKEIRAEKKKAEQIKRK